MTFPKGTTLSWGQGTVADIVQLGGPWAVAAAADEVKGRVGGCLLTRRQLTPSCDPGSKDYQSLVSVLDVALSDRR